MKVASSVLGLIVAILAARYVLNSAAKSLVASATTDKGATCLQMLGSTTSVQDGFTYIIGSIKNNCSQKIGNVTITFKLDRQSTPDVKLPGTMSSSYGKPAPPTKSTFTLPDAVAYAYSRDVQPGETRKFKTAVHISANSTYRFDAIRAY